MIKLNLVEQFRSDTFYDQSKELRFFPPVYEQRYMATIRILEHQLFMGQLKKVVEFGCAEMKLLPLVRRIDGIEHILQVDIDENVLRNFEQRAKPLLTDYLALRQSPLRIDIYQGNIAKSVECIKNIDAVIALELIEHVYPEVLECVPYNIFGYVKPKVAIFSTPNAEFNVFFNLTLPNGFRHYDHKFEWTREQFSDWCINICTRFPNYSVDIIGIGNPPPDKPEFGHVSQMAIFVRKDVLGSSLDDLKIDETVAVDSKPLVEDEYKLISTTVYPYEEDRRSHTEKILDEIKYHINRLTQSERYYNYEKNVYAVPFLTLYQNVTPLVLTYIELIEVLLANGYVLEDNFIIVTQDEERSSLYTDDDEEYNDVKTSTNSINTIQYSSECWDK